MDFQPTEEPTQASPPPEKDGINRGLLKNTRLVGLAAFFIGLLFGWIIIGWYVNPVEWVDASPEYLRQDVKEDYLRMVIDSFAISGDVPRAVSRIDSLGESADPLMATVVANPGNQVHRNAVQTLQPHLGQSGGIATTAVPEGEVGAVPVEEAPQSSTGTLLLYACGIKLILSFFLVVIYFIRKRTKGPMEVTPAMRAQQITRDAETQKTNYDSAGTSPPVAQWMTTYIIGDDLFDDSFSIDTAAGEFMGECGVGIADSVGVGEPKRVSAFEVWLFDKNDIQTITKVIMSDHIFNDESTRARMASKGEPIQATTGFEVVLETATLQMVVRIVDMVYGAGALPENSFFERVTLELAVWTKN
ncbi:MAG: hypothetical protein N2D54_04380 [Chloroflexota bacterium]